MSRTHVLPSKQSPPTSVGCRQHIVDNLLDPENFRLIEAAVAATDGKVGFHVGDTPLGGPGNGMDNTLVGRALFRQSV